MKYSKFKEEIADLKETDKFTAMFDFAGKEILKSPEIALKVYQKIKELAFDNNLIKAKAIMGVCHYHFLKKEFERSDTLCKEALDLMNNNSLEDKAWPWCNSYAYKYFRYGNYNKAITFFNISLGIVKELNNKKSVAGLLGNISSLQIKLGNFAEAEKNMLESISIQDSIQDYIGLARSKNLLAELYYKSGRIERALECYIKAMNNLGKDSNDDINERKILSAIITNNIANIYKDLNDLPKALEYYKKSLKEKEDLNAEDRIAVSLSNIAIIYKGMKKYKKALNYYERALELCKKLNFRTEESNVYLNLGTLFFEMNKLPQALVYYKKSEDLRRTFNDPYSLVKIVLNIGKLQIDLNDLKNAEKYLNESLQLTQKYKFPEEERDAYRIFTDLYDKQKNDSKSNIYRKKYIELNEKLYKHEFSESLAEMKTKFETELKEKESKILREKNLELEKKNIQIEKQKSELENTLENLRRSEINYTFAAGELKKTIGSTIVGESIQIKKIINLISKVAKTKATTVLITGESGTGKELIARAIHDFSDRNKGNFCAVNVSSIPETLFESEFFGYKKNAFTGANADKAGWFEIADKGTLFLDEIGTLSENLQIKLLRVLEEKKIVRIGSNKEISVDIRIISATNSKLLNMIDNGSFRTDLYHRLSTFVINLPPLRERISDIPLLLKHFVKLFSKQMNKKITKVERKAEALLMSYDFPGNIRELKNLIERAIIMSNFSTLKSIHFNIPKSENGKDCNKKIIPLEELEKQMLIKALKATGFHQANAAKLLKIKPKAIERRMIKYGIKK